MKKRQFNTLTGFLSSKSSSPTAGDTVEFQGYSAIGDGGAATWQHKGITGQTPSQSPAQLDDALLNDGNGNQWAMLLSNDFEFETFSELQSSNIGNIGQRLICRERDSANYIIRESSYVALAGDVIFANGLKAELQLDNDVLIDYFGDTSADCIDVYELAESRNTRIIKFLPKVYLFSRKININRSSLALVGPDGMDAVFEFTNNTDGGLIYSPTDPLSPTFLNGQGLSNIVITSTTRNDTDFALSVVKAEKFKGRDIRWSKFANGLRHAGGQSNSYNGLIMQSPTGTGVVSGSAGLRVEAAQNTDLSYQEAYSVNFTDIILSGGSGKVTEDLIDIRNCDGCNFVNGYVAWADRSILKLETTTSKNIAALNFENFYFDGVFKSVSGVPKGLYVAPSTGGGNISASFGQGCFFGQYADVCIDANSTDISKLNFIGTQFSNALDKIGTISGDTASSKISFVGARLRNSNGGVAISDVRSATVTSTTFNSLFGTAALSFSGSISRLIYGDLTFTGNSNDLINTSAYTTDQPITNWSNNLSYTPELLFGGANVGMTYSVQSGQYSRVGEWATSVSNIFLTDKGSSTGPARVSLPVAAKSSSENSAISVYATNMNASLSNIQGNTEPGSSTHTLNSFSAGASSSLTDADFNNNSLLRISVNYRI